MGDSRRHVCDKLYGNVLPDRPVGLDYELKSVYGALRNTVVQKRGHQCILLGARATGKTLLINCALKRLHTEFPDEFIVVKINGLSHSDDKLALREIAKQLDAAITNGDEPIERPSMSHTLKNLNQLFDNAAGDAMELDAEEDTRQSANDNNDDKHTQESKRRKRRVKSVVFVIEELDRYTSSHQVLAYELFDLSQTSPIGVSVIATSTRLNVVELLEKRNRSRSSATVVHTLPKPDSTEKLMAIAQELLRNPANEELVDTQTLERIALQVRYTTNSVRHLASLLVPHVLGIGEDADAQQLLQPSTSERLLAPYDTVPILDWAMLICSARAVVRYETQSVNLVIVLDEWRAMAGADHADRFAEMNAHIRSRVGGNTANGSRGVNGSSSANGGSTAMPMPVPIRPGSTPSSLRAVRQSWERLRKLGLLEPIASQSAQEDLKMYVPELDLDDLREMLPRSFSLYPWTKLE